MDRVEGNQFHLLHVGLAVGGKIFLVADDIHNFSNEVIARSRFADFLLDAALHGHREAAEEGGVDMLCLAGLPSGPCNLVMVLPAAHEPYIVGAHEGILGGEGHRKFPDAVKVLGSGVGAHRNHNLVIVPLAAPCGVHGIGSAVGIVSADDKHRLGKHPGHRSKILHI